MAVVFDYADKLNAIGDNPRSRAEIWSLLVSKVWKVPPEKDGSKKMLDQQSCKKGALVRDVHVLCPPYCVHKCTNGPTKTYAEWLIVSCKGDSYIVVLHTRKGPNGTCTSEVDEVSKKNPQVELENKMVKIKPFVKWWLKKCKLEVSKDPQPPPANPANDGQRLPNASAANIDQDVPDAFYQDVEGNDDGEDESPYNA
jgi:hypothetical protein